MVQTAPEVNWIAAHEAYLRGKMSATQFYREKLREYCVNGVLPTLQAWKSACYRLGKVSCRREQIAAADEVSVIELPGQVLQPESPMHLELANGMRLVIPATISTDFIAELLIKIGGHHAEPQS